MQTIWIQIDIGYCLVFVQIFRHGERSPTGVYPNDPHSNFTWDGGYGALTLVFMIFFRVKILPRSPNVILKYLLPMFRKVHYRHIIKE